MTSPNPGPSADGDHDRDGDHDDQARDRDAEILALLLAELRAATAAARARGATDEQVHRLIEQRRAALRRSLPTPGAPGSDAAAENAEHRGDDPVDLRGIA